MACPVKKCCLTPISLDPKVWKVVNERYAQVGIKLNVLGGTLAEVKDPPTGVDLNDADGLNFTNNQTLKPLAHEAKTVIEKYGTKGNKEDIHIIYVPRISAWGGARGISVVDSFYPGDDNAYAYNIFIDGSLQNTTTNPEAGIVAAHELGHLLLDDPNHRDSEPENLMYGLPDSSLKVFSSKRLDKSQEGKIQGNSHAK